MTDPALNLSLGHPDPVICEWPDILLYGDEKITIDKHTIRVLHTPGHSPGSVSYAMEEYVFTGDTLMAGLIGPTEIPGGNREQLKLSIKEKLYMLHDETIVLPGHGDSTIIGYEKKTNVFPNIKSYMT